MFGGQPQNCYQIFRPTVKEPRHIPPAADVCQRTALGPRFMFFRRKTMRRSFILTSVLAVSTAVLGACDPKSTVPNKPVATPTASPAASPVASPSVSPVKPGTTPEVKKTDDKKPPAANDVGKGVKLEGTPVKRPQ
jgi:hypothetical protein